MGFDYAIIGGGVVGLSVAWGLLRRGHKVVVLDGSDGSFRASRGNFGLVWVQSKGLDRPEYARWSQRSTAKAGRIREPSKPLRGHTLNAYGSYAALPMRNARLPVVGTICAVLFTTFSHSQPMPPSLMGLTKQNSAPRLS